MQIPAQIFGHIQGTQQIYTKKYNISQQSFSKCLKFINKNLKDTSNRYLPNIMIALYSTTDLSVQYNPVYANVFQVTGKIFTNQTIFFPVTSSQGNNYVMGFYYYNSSGIIYEPLK